MLYWVRPIIWAANDRITILKMAAARICASGVSAAYKAINTRANPHKGK